MERKYLKIIEVLSEAIIDKDNMLIIKRNKLKEYEKEISDLKAKIEQIEQYVDFYNK